MKYTAKQLGMRHKQGAAKNDQVIEMLNGYPKKHAKSMMKGGKNRITHF